MAAPNTGGYYTKEEYPFPSQFGSHASMVVQDETDRLGDTKFVVCKDAEGLYVTEKSRLDDGLADVYRHSSVSWRVEFLQRKLGEVFDIVQ